MQLRYLSIHSIVRNPATAPNPTQEPHVMAKQQSSGFRFRKTDTIGATSAEDDTEFLRDCFVETDDFEVLKDIDDIRQIVLGRTGAGKSALFERLKHEDPERVIAIEPHRLALNYVSNSSVLKYFSDLGVNMDPFHKLLWRHVLTVEILRRHFEPLLSQEQSRFWDMLIETFKRPTRQDERARKCIEYLRRWGDKFWLETEYRVKEITKKMESDLRHESGLDLSPPALKVACLRTRRY